MALVKDGEADFIQNLPSRYGDHLDTTLQWGERLGSSAITT